MSYILDALRKADAERERDPARGIHAQPATGATAVAARARPAAWTWLAGAAIAVSALGVVLWQNDAVPAADAQARAATPPAVIAPVAAPVVPAAVPVQVSAPLPVATAVQPAAPPMPAAPLVTAKASPPVAATPAPPAAQEPAATSDRVLAVAELPADVRRDLPKLAITGGVHSDNAAQRMLIVGGQVMAEGAELAPGVVLEQIRPKTAVLRFRGYRYSVGY